MVSYLKEVTLTASYFVRYIGAPEDREAFIKYYREQHALIMQEYPGIQSCKLHFSDAWTDPVDVNRDSVFLIAELVFNSITELNQALQSEARQRSRQDFINFPKFNGTVTHLAVTTET